MASNQQLFHLAKLIPEWKAFELFTGGLVEQLPDCNPKKLASPATNAEALWQEWLAQIPAAALEDTYAKLRSWFEDALRYEDEQLAEHRLLRTSEHLRLVRRALVWTLLSDKVAGANWKAAFTFRSDKMNATNLYPYLDFNSDQGAQLGTVTLHHEAPDFAPTGWSVINTTNDEALIEIFLDAVVNLPLIHPSPDCTEAKQFIRDFKAAPANTPTLVGER